jgi:hypothetical protein
METAFLLESRKGKKQEKSQANFSRNARNI